MRVGVIVAVLALALPAAAHWLRPAAPEAIEVAQRHGLLDAGPKPVFSAAPEDLAAHLGKGLDGGRGVAPHAGARRVADPPFGLPSGIQRSIGRSTFEPSIGVTSDGSVFYIAIDESG